MNVHALLALSFTLAAAPRAALVDVSAPDAVYEDESRAIANQMVAQLAKVGVDAVRVEEAELPEGGCRYGPCLGELGKLKQANLVISMDVVQLKGGHWGIAIATLAARNGQPLASGKFELKKLTDTPKGFKAYLAQMKKLVEGWPKPDAGS